MVMMSYDTVHDERASWNSYATHAVSWIRVLGPLLDGMLGRPAQPSLELDSKMGRKMLNHARWVKTLQKIASIPRKPPKAFWFCFFFLNGERPEGRGNITLTISGGCTSFYKGPHKKEKLHICP
jgi:hypothetical protein